MWQTTRGIVGSSGSGWTHVSTPNDTSSAPICDVEPLLSESITLDNSELMYGRTCNALTGRQHNHSDPGQLDLRHLPFARLLQTLFWHSYLASIKKNKIIHTKHWIWDDDSQRSLVSVTPSSRSLENSSSFHGGIWRKGWSSSQERSHFIQHSTGT